MENTSQPSSSRKRKREEFIKGSIVRISVINFLTYDQCTFRLNPKLNVIIGPNGTGKSSVVCAICLGLGGKPNVLARAKEIGDFIKHGCDKATIEIELSNTPKNTIIKREISQCSGSKATSSWFVNGSQTNIKSIEEITNSLSIQLSNLCQFLPQERVSDFAKMNKIELLENTEHAVCSVSMQEDHQWLKQFRSREKELEIKQTDDQAYLDKLIQKNQTVEKEVLRYKEKTKLMNELKVLDQKKAWTEYELARCEYVDKKDALDKLLKKRNEEDKKTLPLIKENDKINNHMSNIDKQMKKKGEDLKTSAGLTKKLHDKINETDEEVAEVWEEYKEREKDEQMRLKRVEQFKHQLSDWRNELNQMEECNVQSELDELNAKIRSVVTSITQAEHEHDVVTERKRKTHSEVKRCENAISELNNMSKKRLEILRRRNRDCYSAIQWLRSNKAMFKSTIHEPMMLLINVKSHGHAEMVENHIAGRDMCAFLCEDPEDNKKFIGEVREKQGLRINVVRAPRASDGSLLRSSSFVPRTKLNDLKKWGFTSYLRESFDAPDAVMAYLCKQYRVHEIPVGSAHTKSIVDQVTASSGFGLFYIPALSSSVPGCRYSVRRSKYSANQIVGNSALRKADYLSINVDPEEVRNIQQEMQGLLQSLADDAEKLGDIKKEQKKMEKKDNELRSKKKELQLQKNKRKNLENKIMLKETNLQNLEQTGLDLASLKRETQSRASTILMQKKKLVMKFVEKIKICVDSSIEKGLIQADYAHSLRKKISIEERIRRMKMGNQELLRAIERTQSAKQELQKQAKELLVIARKKTGRENPAALGNDFVKFPDDLAEIEAKIHEYEARLECCGDTDPKAFEEFTCRKKDIEKLERKVENIQQELETKRSEMLVVKERWIQPLRDLIDSINSRFSRYFAQMGCAGEVDLHAENEDDFDNYGIRIRVKFRSSSTLQELNPFRQSGGERSVSTMLYLVALQNIYASPFRLVDEINQGMDPNNERRVFEVIVNTTKEEPTSQYFLITPKLLPNLTYNRHMTVHCVYNGSKMLPHNQWKVGRFVRKRKQLMYEDDDD